MQYLLLGIFFTLFVTNNAFSQFAPSGANAVLNKSISTTDSLLNGSNDYSISEKLMLVSAKVNNREELLQQMRNQLLLLDFAIGDLKSDLEALEQDLQQIKSEYAKMIFYAYRNRNSYDQMIFILSANSFNQSYKRLKYLQQYSDYRKKQASLIIGKKDKINTGISQLSYNKKKKQVLLSNFQREQELLKEDKRKALKLQKQAGSNDTTAENKVVDLYLQDVLDTVFIDKKHTLKQNNKQYALKATPFRNKTIGLLVDTSAFENNKELLPWPVVNSFVYNYFGNHPHPHLEGIMLYNDGIDISTENDCEVTAVFKGKVSKVILIPGSNSAVLLSHGNYYSLYANLREVYVKVGDNVQHRQRLGKIYAHTDNKNFSKLHFQLWHKNKKIDPLIWLKRN